MNGYIVVSRPEMDKGEHKFYLRLTEDEEEAVLSEFEPVLTSHGRFETYEELIAAIEPFQNPK